VVEVLTLIIVAIYAALTWWQAHATQRMANLTRDQFPSHERAWVGPVKIGLVDPPIAVGKTVTGVIELNNLGKTPAKRSSYPGLDSGPRSRRTTGPEICGR
jgi:hypothetical protein